MARLTVIPTCEHHPYSFFLVVSFFFARFHFDYLWILIMPLSALRWSHRDQNAVNTAEKTIASQSGDCCVTVLRPSYPTNTCGLQEWG
uniref:Uncharacterized protein n=1 Tax=Anguilla anguilla TaxID=7936 RepID=A0A0E9WGN7_ANGAN